MLLIYSDGNSWTKDEVDACLKASLKISDEMQAAGNFIDASPLEFVEEAKSIRDRDRRVRVTDGPFAETKEL